MILSTLLGKSKRYLCSRLPRSKLDMDTNHHFCITPTEASSASAAKLLSAPIITCSCLHDLEIHRLEGNLGRNPQVLLWFKLKLCKATNSEEFWSNTGSSEGKNCFICTRPKIRDANQLRQRHSNMQFSKVGRNDTYFKLKEPWWNFFQWILRKIHFSELIFPENSECVR